MARYEPETRIAESHHVWLAIVLVGALQGCLPDSATPRSADVGAGKTGIPAVGRANQPAAPAAVRIEEISIADPSTSDPVTATMTIQPRLASVGDTVEVLVRIRIASAHFIHATDDTGGPYLPVTMNATFPSGLEPIGDWQFPPAENGRGSSRVYRHSVVLRRLVRVSSGSTAQSLTVPGELEYQVCTDEVCWPRGKLELFARLEIQSQRR